MTHRDRKPSVEDLLLDIVERSERLASHIEGATVQGFLHDKRLQDAVCRCVEVIGEAAGRLKAPDSGLQQRHPDVDLVRAYGTRNLLAHGYAVVDYGIIWNTATEAVPKLAAAARALLPGGS